MVSRGSCFGGATLMQNKRVWTNELGKGNEKKKDLLLWEKKNLRGADNEV